MITKLFRKTFTSADADCFLGSELEAAPADGVIIIRAASTVNTATLEVTPEKGPRVSFARAITLRANAEVQSGDVPWIVPVVEGEKVTVALSGTTGTVYIEAPFLGD